MEKNVENMNLTDLALVERLTQRSQNVCINNRLLDLFSIYDYYLGRGHFKSLRNCGSKSNFELIDLCNKYSDAISKQNYSVTNADKLISIQTGIDLLTYNQCGLINDFINCQFKLLSVRSANALTALLGKTIDLNSIKLLFPVRVEKLKDLKNVGNKSVFELDTFLQRL